MILGAVSGNLQDTKKRETWEELLIKLTGIDYTMCPCCKEEKMIRKIKLEPRCYSPPQIKAQIA